MAGFFKNLFKSSPKKNTNLMKIQVECDHCHAIVNLTINKLYDVRPDEAGDGFLLNKEVQDSNCFRIMPMRGTFDNNKNLIDLTIQNGKIVSVEE